ncbi:PD-(D/E)XK nuclease family protein [Undibacterium arcticum]
MRLAAGQRGTDAFFSVFGRKDERGAARDALFAAEEDFKAQEDWNLLYVAATRAKQILIVSGVADKRNSAAGGMVDGSWYARLQQVPLVAEAGRAALTEAPPSAAALVVAGTVDQVAASPDAATFRWPVFEPAAMAAPAITTTTTTGDERRDKLADAAIDEGIALHALLERLTQGRAWPVAVPDAATIARWLPCAAALAQTVRAQALTILSQPQLEHFYNPALHQSAHNEMEVLVDGATSRFDRVVVFDDAVWILDYKRNLLESERAAYQAQLAGYRRAGQAVFGGKVLNTALITVDGRLWPFE